MADVLRPIIKALGMVLCALGAYSQSTAWGQNVPSTVAMRQDAGLSSITFIDADRGWAVGDRGVIWHTTDGGRNWRLQNSGSTARLESIAMMDAENGWVVGGYTQPYTHETVGIVLRTRDGGRTWQASPDASLPYLRHVKFFSAKQGWALGDSSALYPSGAFYTEDGGKTWTTVAKGETEGWLAGDFRDFRGGAMAGRGGQLVAVTAQQMKESRVAPLGKRNARRMVLWPDARGWLVGDGGLVLKTLDGGHSWNGPEGALPNLAGDGMDFEAVASLADHVWVAGTPGTLVLHSANAGKTWEVFDTQQTTPIKSLFFVDQNRGFAACELGVIMATLDGGRTWTVQHSGGKRAAMLGIFSQPERVCWDLVAQQAGSEGYLTTLEILGRRDDTRQGATLPQRSREALVTVGGSSLSTAWRFPLREQEISMSAQSIMQYWDDANDGHAKELIEAHLVRQIRLWRPDVIATEDVSPRGDDPLGHVTNQLVLSAVQKAADPNAFSGQIFDLHLDVWKVKKVFSIKRGGQAGVVTITPAQWLARLNRSIADQAELGRSLIETTVQDRASMIGLSLLVDHLPQQAGRRDVFSGLVLLPGGEARRELDDVTSGDLEFLSRAAQKRHNVEQLLSRMDRDVAQGAAWLGQLDDLTKGLNPDNASEITYQMAMRFQRLGRSDSACEVLHTLLEKYPKHPLAGKAAVWLIEYYSSSETFHRERRESRFVSSIATVDHPLQHSPDEVVEDADLKQREVQPASFASQGVATSAHARMSLGDRTGRALAVAQQIEKTRPVLHAEPQLRFSLAKALRQQGQGRAAEKFFNSLLSQRPGDPWARCAEAELWLNSTAGASPKKIVNCATAVQRPTLDGRLEEEIWRYAKAVSLTANPVDELRLKELPAVAVMAFDEEFLYLAVSCKRVTPGMPQDEQSAPRKHDEDLSHSDRVQLILDVDRDYGSYYVMSVDSKGRTAESCFGDVTWNPAWYVAAAGDQDYWTVEVAIPLAELVSHTPKAKDVWAVGIQRVVPEKGLQAFSLPASATIRPEGLGLLMFE